MIGRKLNHYNILEKIGAGGMGEVYAAEDTRLHRRVALKVLPASLADSPERRARFEREATAIASLNHANIVTVHSVEAAEGISFITMELVEGKPLSEVIPPKGLPLRRFFDLAIPMSDALASAHRAGVIHRDLKPDNVVVGEEGRLKILDFGLAKLRATDDDTPERTSLPTRHLTGQGQVLGTVAYMSPEQVEGKALDHRTDIFSLGIVLYEMATGRRPFRGDTPASVISSLLRDTPPPVTEVRGGLPRHLGRILRHCLAKDPDERTQSAQDVRNQLVDLRREIDSGSLDSLGAVAASAAARARPRWIAVTGILAAITLLALSAFLIGGRGEPGGGPSGGRSLGGTQVKLTDASGQEVTPSIAPDGRSFVYASRAAGNWDIWAQRVGGSNAVNLTVDSPADDIEPAFSPDGERIAFRSEREGGGIFVMGATGESVLRVTDFGYRPAWSPDGKRIAFGSSFFSNPAARPSSSELWLAEVGTGEPLRLYEGDALQPDWAPGGRRIAFWGLQRGGGQRDISTISIDGGDPVPVTQDPALDWNPVWSPDGDYLHFSSNRGGAMNVWRVPIDEDSGQPLGNPEPVTFGAASEIHSVSIARDGRRLLFVASTGSWGIRSVSLDHERGVAVVDPVAMSRGSTPIVWPALSADGQWLAYSTVGAGERAGMVREAIIVASRDGSSRRIVAASDSRNRMPRWSPSGDRLLFTSDRNGTYGIYAVRSDGSDLQPVSAAQEDAIYPVWSPTGDRIAFTNNSHPFRGRIMPWPPASDGMEELPPLPGKGGSFVPVDWSHDGRFLAGHRERIGGEPGGIVLYRLDTRDYEVVIDRGMRPHWLPDNRSILFTEANAKKLFVVDVLSRKIREMPLDIEGGFDSFNLSLSGDGRMVTLIETDHQADLWLLDLE